MTDLSRPWYRREPERLHFELEQLQAHGFDAPAAADLVDVDDAHIRVDVDVDTPEGMVVETVRIAFPFDYPLWPPRFHLETDRLERHQSATTGHLCVPARERDWWPGRSAASLLDGPVRALLTDSARGPAAVAAGEVDMPEPASSRLPYCEMAELLVPGEMWDAGEDTDCGRATFERFGTHGGRRLVGLHTTRTLRAPALPGRHHDRPDTRPTERGYWARIDAPGAHASRSDIVAAARTHPPVRARLDRKAKRGQRELVAVTFREEGPTRVQQRWAWALLTLPDGDPERAELGPAIRFDEEGRGERIPELDGLDAARFLVIGAGSVGGPITCELAKAGAEAVTVVDGDVHQAHNAVRHVLPASLTGAFKANAVAAVASELNPFCRARGVAKFVGEPELQGAALQELLAAHDVVVDATGSRAARHVLDAYARQQRRPLVSAGLTEGASGAELVVINPDGPCIHCFEELRDDRMLPEPPAAPAQEIVPTGCATPTFTGAGFEATQLAAVATRTAVRASSVTRYPPLDFDWVVLAFRGDEPAWQQGRLHRTAACQQCA